MKRVVLLATTLVGLMTAGCVHTGFTRTAAIMLPERPPNCYLDLVLQGQPAYPYIVIGQVSTDSTAPGLFALGESNDVAIERMKEQACAVGAHGLMNVAANSQGVWNGDGYSKSTTGGAVAFVYVDPAGRPLPPPNGPHVVIQPGAYPPIAAATPPPAPPMPPPTAAAPPPPAPPPPAPAQ